jgi:hypothetical protein
MGRARRREIWLDHNGEQLKDFGLHPGAVLSFYIGWQRPTGAWATIPDPEPDTINVAVLSDKPVLLDLPHVYHAQPRTKQGYWISFGRSNNPSETINSLEEPWIASWTNLKANPARVYQHRELPRMTFAKDIPQGQRWQYIDKFCEQ